MSYNCKKMVIDELKDGMRNVEIEVRVIRKWKTFNSFDNKDSSLKGLELLFMDEKVPKNLVKRMDQNTIEGKMYHLSKFTVEPNTFNDKATSAKLRLDIGYTTNAVEALNLPIPMYGFKFTPIGDIINEHVDGSTYLGEVQISTVNQATKFHMNLDVPEVKEFLTKRISTGEEGSSSMVVQTSFATKDILGSGTLKSLYEIKNCDKPGFYVTIATLIDVESKYSWFYDSCKLCRSKAILGKDGLWYCKSRSTRPSAKPCIAKEKGQKESIPRYVFQVKFFVQGGINVFSEFMIFDSIIEKMINKSAAEIISKQKQNGEEGDMPSEFAILLDHEYVAKLKVSDEYNIEKNSMCYTIYDLNKDANICVSWKEKYAVLQDCASENDELTLSISSKNTPIKRTWSELSDAQDGVN
ncbi:hypothetical protein RND81_01G123800 [Saponaria officinalis]|uniref:Replication factor A C-terminal domain-containing protein n=1 Tax=Saponaria officinalis TaxID=3572 RepID=A0AAW1NEP3_SAPOF